eukprot:TRINITY_DN13970_c0_g1_i1.p1 TRINITY_DN13970_c0_g1~~TRINITY_DN13970_c0_g1_i1.p1  ORF type:complete len:614 (+),score=82.50 TRINITY_DN13970_c0_g1_i1:87-1928(+)
MIANMQLAALASKSRLSIPRFCSKAIPVFSGGTLSCAFLLLCGILEIREFCNIGRGEGFILRKAAVETNRALVAPVSYVVLILGVGSVVAALVGLYGVALRKAVPAAGLTAWLLAHLVLRTFVAIIVVVYDTAGLGWGRTSVLAVPVLLWDLFLACFGLELLLTIALNTMSQSCIASMQHARLVARDSGASACDRTHLVAAFLQDPVSRRDLQDAGANVTQMEGCLAFPVPYAAQSAAADSPALALGRQEALDKDGTELDSIPFSSDIKDTLYDATLIQQCAGDEQLTPDHILLAMCSSGCFTINVPAVPAQGVAARRLTYAVDAIGIRHRLSAARCSLKASGHADVDFGATAFGCLPMEEIVAAWGVLQCVVLVATALFLPSSFIWIKFDILGGKGKIALAASLAAVGAVVSWGVVLGIRGHRQARQCVKEAARRYEVGSGAGFSAAFNAMRSETESSGWSQRMKHCADLLRLFLLWSMLELIADAALLGTAALRISICGSYVHGLAATSRLAFYLSGSVPLHCSEHEAGIITIVVPWMVLKLLLCRAVFLLWHEYMYSWAATAPGDSACVQPVSIMPEVVTRIMAGLLRLPSRKRIILYIVTGGETKPLLA